MILALYLLMLQQAPTFEITAVSSGQLAYWNPAPETHERVVHLGTKAFTVRYLVEHTGMITIPAVGGSPRQSHYDAKIQVFGKHKQSWTHGASCGALSASCYAVAITEEIEVDVPLGRQFSGKWTANGCKVDDDPIEYVRRAFMSGLAEHLP